LKKLKRTHELIKTYSIVNRKNGHFSYYESVGQKYCDLSVKTGGLCSNIKDDFSTILSNLGKNIVELKENFILKERPISSIKVHVDGVLSIIGWTYDSHLNAIRFDEGLLPEEGAEVEISYEF
jgi:hypothetical protein